MSHTIKEIQQYPTLFVTKEHGKCHESILKSYHILEKVVEMLNRGDSAETIIEVIGICKGNDVERTIG